MTITWWGGTIKIPLSRPLPRSIKPGSLRVGLGRVFKSSLRDSIVKSSLRAYRQSGGILRIRRPIS